jgi:hypothetical protein
VSNPVSDERLKRALVAAAYVVTHYGARYAPLFERLEREMECRAQRNSTEDRAHRLLRAFAQPDLPVLTSP